MDDTLWRSDGTAAGTVQIGSGFYFDGNTTAGPMVSAGGNVFFAARATPDSASPQALWVTDGTAAGTRPLWQEQGAGAWSLREAGDQVYFHVTGANGRRELWRSDGSAAGTSRVHAYPSKSQFAGSVAHLPADGRVYFAGYDPQHGMEVWSTDGTAAGTSLFKDVNPGPASSSPSGFTTSHGKVLFTATGPTNRRELWITDGTDGGTTELREFSSTQLFPPFVPAGPQGSGLTVFAINGDPWVTDGTPAGTRRLGPFGDEAPYSIESLTRAGDTVFFKGTQFTPGHELWATDGTSVRRVKDINPRGSSFPTNLRAVGDRVFFNANDGTGGRQLWVSDGTEGGTVLVKRYDAAAPASPRPLLGAGGELFFLMNEGLLGEELYVSDGTEAGTRLVKDLDTRPLSSNPEFGAALGGDYLVSAQGANSPRSWWRVDGDAGEPGAAPPVNTGATRVPSTFNGFPVRLKTYNGVLLFQYDSRDVFLTDGTAAGTQSLGTSWSSWVEPSFTEYNGRLYFISYPGNYYAVHSTDGTVAGSRPLLPQMVRETVTGLAATDQYLYFAGKPWAAEGEELWRSDGTAAGTQRLFSWQRAGRASAIENLFALGNRLLFTWETPAGVELYSLADGATTPTLVERLTFFIPDSARPFKLGDKVYIAGGTHATGIELLVTDGTPGGTRMVKDGRPGARESSDPIPLAALGERLVFWAYDGTFPFMRSLWITDGTEAGTVRLTPPGVRPLDGPPGGGWQQTLNEPGRFAVAGDRFYFVADDPGYGREIWSTDGTPQGTFLHADVIPGPTGSDPGALAAVGDALFFAANHPSVGREVWKIAAGAAGPGSVVARHVFYNNSAFDGRNPAANAADDAAVATDKRPAVAGQHRAVEQVINYSRGINGVMIDARHLPAGTTLTADDFSFRAGTAADPSTWAPLAARPTVVVRRGAGVHGSDRITLIWPDGAVRNTWLEVTLKSSDRTGLAAPHVFTIGNLVGDTSVTGAGVGRVDAADLFAVRAARGTRTTPTPSRLDINRDGVVNVLDEALVRAHQRRRLSLPSAPPAAHAATAAPPAPRRRSLYEDLATR